jgi:hypothetical protein
MKKVLFFLSSVFVLLFAFFDTSQSVNLESNQVPYLIEFNCINIELELIGTFNDLTNPVEFVELSEKPFDSGYKSKLIKPPINLQKTHLHRFNSFR